MYKVRKRNGTIVDFEIQKITDAMITTVVITISVGTFKT
jgi:hypothetical protein